jgi:hypothetical protein
MEIVNTLNESEPEQLRDVARYLRRSSSIRNERPASRSRQFRKRLRSDQTTSRTTFLPKRQS